MIPPEEWERCRHWIEAALEYGGGTHSIDDVRIMCERGDARFWPGRNAAAVVEVITFPRKTVLHLWLNGGDMSELLDDMLPEVEAWGVELGCDLSMTTGRPGWDRAMKPYGYAPVAHICTKELAR